MGRLLAAGLGNSGQLWGRALSSGNPDAQAIGSSAGALGSSDDELLRRETWMVRLLAAGLGISGQLWRRQL